MDFDHQSDVVGDVGALDSRMSIKSALKKSSKLPIAKPTSRVSFTGLRIDEEEKEPSQASRVPKQMPIDLPQPPQMKDPPHLEVFPSALSLKSSKSKDQRDVGDRVKLQKKEDIAEPGRRLQKSGAQQRQQQKQSRKQAQQQPKQQKQRPLQFHCEGKIRHPYCIYRDRCKIDCVLSSETVK